MASEKRLIDANDLLNAIRDDYNINGTNFARIRQHIEDAPAVDAVEVVHGRWIEKEKYTFGVMYDCSICDNRILDNGHSWNYCPNCGCRMDGGDDE